MKSRSETTGKTRGNGSARQAAARAERAASSGNYECPREQMIAEAAYFRAEQRGFASGNEMSDWLQAEADVERALSSLH